MLNHYAGHLKVLFYNLLVIACDQLPMHHAARVKAWMKVGILGSQNILNFMYNLGAQVN